MTVDDDTKPTPSQVAEQVYVQVAARITKFPEFDTSEVEFYFDRVEATFASHGLKNSAKDEETKFQYLVQYSEKELSPFVKEVLRNPPTDGSSKYEVVKSKVLSTYVESEETRLRRIFSGQGLNGRKPSLFVQDLRNKGGKDVSEAILRTLLLEQLPDNIRSVLGISTETDIDKLSKMADRMIELQQPSYSVSAVQRPQDTASTSVTTELLQSIICRLDRLETGRQSRRDNFQARSVSRHRSRQRSKSREQANRQKGFCFYHSRFGEKARKCEEPCSWRSGNSNPGN